MNKEIHYLSHRIHALNGLRGFCAILIFLWHAGVEGIPGAFISVDMFFIQSGFLITALLLQDYQKNGTIGFKNFYMNRLLRLFPALITLLLCFVLFSLFYYKDFSDKLFSIQDALITLFYAANWTRAFDLDRPVILGHCWSLSIEEQFYAIWPLLLFCLLRLSAMWRPIFIGTLFLLSWGWRVWLLDHGASWNRLYNGFDCRADMLLAGCLLAVLWNAGHLNFWSKNRVVAKCLIFVSSFFLIGFVMVGNWKTAEVYQYQFFLVAVALVVIIFEMVSNEKGLVGRIFSFKPIVWLGNVSYGFYLWHYPVIHFLGDATDWNKPVFVASGILITLIFTAISWYGIEKFFLKFKNRYQLN